MICLFDPFFLEKLEGRCLNIGFLITFENVYHVIKTNTSSSLLLGLLVEVLNLELFMLGQDTDLSCEELFKVNSTFLSHQ